MKIAMMVMMIGIGVGKMGYAMEIDLSAISAIESQGCKAPCVGDGGRALGPFQLHQGVVADFNKAHKTSYKHQIHALEPITATLIADWYLHKKIPTYLKHYKKPVTLENVLTAYNMGIGAVVKGKRAGKYIEKYRRLTT